MSGENTEAVLVAELWSTLSVDSGALDEAEGDKQKKINTVREMILESKTVAELKKKPFFTLFPLDDNKKPTYSHLGGTVYEKTYISSWMHTQRVIVKQSKNFSKAICQAILHELKMTDKFLDVTPRCLALEPLEDINRLRAAYEYYPLSLYEIMKDMMFDLDQYRSVLKGISVIMASFEKENYLLRDFTLSKFRGIICKLMIQKQ